MNRHSKIISAVSLFSMLLAAGFILRVQAAIMPTLSLNDMGNGYTQINVNADPNAAVQLYYSNPYIQFNTQSLGNIGYTSNSGALSVTVPDTQYNVTSGASVYVVVDGATSQAFVWPYSTNSPYTANNYPSNYSANNSASYNYYTAPISFSQSSISLNPGQSSDITISGGSDSYYISAGSPIVGATISGNNLALYGNTAGLATLVICSNDSCGNVYVTITNPTPVYPVSFSQNNISLVTGQNQSVTIYGNGDYYIYGNSNSNVMSASISGNTLYAYANSPGTAAVTICQSGGSCASMYATVIANVAVYPQTYIPSPVAYQPPYIPTPVVYRQAYTSPVSYSYPRQISYYYRPISQFFSYLPRMWRSVF